MFCARCGEQIPDASETCPLCGREATLQIAPAPLPPPLAPHPRDALPSLPKIIGPCGIGGWLLFYCIVLTILTPLLTLAQVSRQLRFLNPYYLIDGARVLYGLVAGVVLWMGRPVALVLLKIYFIIIAATVLLAALGLFAAALRTHASVFMALGFIRVMEQAGFTILWFAYFRKSIRVRNTYGANL